MAQRLAMDGGGWLELREQGSQVHLSASRKLDGAGLYKVWLHGDQGSYLMGTLIPEGDHLRLSRTVSRDALVREGCWPVISVRSAMAFPFSGSGTSEAQSRWRWEHYPARRFQDNVLADAVAAWGSMLLREDSEGFQLAAPFDPHHPFPVPSIFCFCCIRAVDGQPHVVFHFSFDGTPHLPEP